MFCGTTPTYSAPCDNLCCCCCCSNYNYHPGTPWRCCTRRPMHITTTQRITPTWPAGLAEAACALAQYGHLRLVLILVLILTQRHAGRQQQLRAQAAHGHVVHCSRKQEAHGNMKNHVSAKWAISAVGKNLHRLKWHFAAPTAAQVPCMHAEQRVRTTLHSSIRSTSSRTTHGPPP